MTGRLVAVRHAPLDAEGLCVGRTDMRASMSPESAAEHMLQALGDFRADQVWSSPLSRCREPAAAVARALDCPLHIDDRLLELSFGRWEGCRWDELERREPLALQRWMADWRHRRPPHGETVAELQARVGSWHETLDDTRDHLLVAHAGVVRALRVLRNHGTWEQAMRQPVPHLRPLSF